MNIAFVLLGHFAFFIIYHLNFILRSRSQGSFLHVMTDDYSVVGPTRRYYPKSRRSNPSKFQPENNEKKIPNLYQIESRSAFFLCFSVVDISDLSPISTSYLCSTPPIVIDYRVSFLYSIWKVYAKMTNRGRDFQDFGGFRIYTI